MDNTRESQLQANDGLWTNYIFVWKINNSILILIEQTFFDWNLFFLGLTKTRKQLEQSGNSENNLEKEYCRVKNTALWSMGETKMQIMAKDS